MQTIIRKRRSNSRNGNIRYVAFACFSLILSSCSLFSKNLAQEKSKIQILKELKENICKKASGRGRIIIFSETHRFTYESELTNDEFKLFIDIPFKGQESIVLDLKNYKNVNGTIVRKAYSELTLKRDNTSKALLNSFFEKTTKFFQIVSGDIDTQCKNKKCDKINLKKDEEVISYDDKISNKIKFSLSFKNLKLGHYRSASIKAYQESETSKALLGLDLSIDTCK